MARKLFYKVFLLWGVVTLLFFYHYSNYVGITCPPSRELALQYYEHFNKPVITQYLLYFLDIIQGNLGFSCITGSPVVEVLSSTFPITVSLIFLALFLSLLVGIPIGFISALRKNEIPDQIVKFFSIFGISAPSFWLTILAALVFLYGGRALKVPFSMLVQNPPWTSALWQTPPLSFTHFILPSFVIAVWGFGSIAIIMRKSMIDIFEKDYIKIARMEGSSKWNIISKHAFRNICISLLSSTGDILIGMLSGIILIETIIGLPGFGRFTLISFLAYDIDAIVGGVLSLSFIFISMIFLADILRYFLDPRIRYPPTSESSLIR